jgi:hypothetical protein
VSYLLARGCLFVSRDRDVSRVVVVTGSSRLDRDAFKVIPVLVVFFLLLKVYVVGRFSLTTAGALVSAAPLSVLVGTVSSYLNMALFLAGISILGWLIARWGAGRRGASGNDEPDLDAVAVGVCLVCVAFFPVPDRISYFTPAVWKMLAYIIGTGLVLAVIWGAAKLLGRRDGGELFRWVAGKPNYFIAVYVVALLFPTLSSPWVPAEVIVLRHPIAIQDSHLDRNGKLGTSNYAVVYVLSESGQWTTVLDAETRILVRLPTDEVVHRQVCRYKGQPPGTMPLWAVLAGQRYHSPNTMCDTLVEDHRRRLDPLIPDSGQVAPTPSSEVVEP